MLNPRQTTETLSRGLGWFSIAVGAAELLAPRSLGRVLGMEERAGLVQAYGLREIATGLAILSTARRKKWLWGRVAGDALDLATLAAGLGRDNPQRRNVGLAMGAVAAVTLVDAYAANREPDQPAPQRPVRDYSDRRGFPDTPENMRGIARRERSNVRDTEILNPLI